jgi:hypothetical protein
MVGGGSWSLGEGWYEWDCSVPCNPESH